MPGPEEIPDGAMIECSCGTVVADLVSWEGHASTHETSRSWDFIQADDGTPYPLEGG